MWYVSGRKKRRKGLAYRFRLFVEELNYLGEKVIARRLRRLFAQFLFFVFFLISTIFISGIVGCGGPPQNTDVGEEGPASLSVSAGGDVGQVVTSIASQHRVTITNSSASISASQMLLTSGPSTPFSFVGGNFPGTGGDCSDTLAPLSSCDVVLEVNALVIGNLNTSFSISDWDGLATQTLIATLTGTARDPCPGCCAA